MIDGNTIRRLGVYTPATPFDFIVKRRMLRDAVNHAICHHLKDRVYDLSDCEWNDLINLYEKETLYSGLLMPSNDDVSSAIYRLIFRIYDNLDEYDKGIRDDVENAIANISDTIQSNLERMEIKLFPDYIELTGYEYYEITFNRDVIVIRCLADKRIVEYHNGAR